MGFRRYFSIFLIGFSLVNCSESYRLPECVTPEHYDLEIITNLGDDHNNFDFLGKMWIKLNCHKGTKNVTLHSKSLDINKKEVTIHEISQNTKSEIKPTSFIVDKVNDFFVIYFDEPLTPGHKYELFISYKGVLQDSLDGYYKSSYIDKETQEKRWLAVTQFEAISARKAFPCFDEPAMKATFSISLGRLKKYKSISNMPLQKTEPFKDKPEWFWDRFEKSVPMSTYLVAFMVSDFTYKESPKSENNVTFRVWSKKDSISQVEFASEAGPKILEYYEKFFDIEYPLPKQDMVAIPDFNAGAMENWGLITYREAYLLHDPELSSAYSKQSVASVVAHELAHQWFGNLVTMKWWTDLWLNEGFATYMSTLGVHHILPTWGTLDEDAMSNLLQVYKFDSLLSSHPISVPIGHPRDIDQIFDTISYKKGSTIIRMMATFLGEDIFRKGVTDYLLKHKYHNAEQNDLWDALTKEAHTANSFPKNLTVKDVMDTWTLQTGYPILQVNRLYGKNAIEITQERYLRDTTIPQKQSSQCWWVPLTYTTQREMDFNSTQPKHWLSCNNEKQIFKGFPDECEWIIFNIQGSALYRINYDQKNWELLTQTLNSDKFNTIAPFSRLQIIDNAASLAWTGHLKYDVFFDILKYLEREPEYLPWETALSQIQSLNRLLLRTSFYGKLQEYVRKVLEKPYRNVGGMSISKSTLENPQMLKKQILIVSAACRFGVEECVQDAVKLFKAKLKSNTNVPKDLRKIIYCTGIRNGGRQEWDDLWEMYNKSDNSNEKYHIMGSLGCTKEVWLLRRYLAWSIQPNSGIRKQDATSVFTSVTPNPIGYYVSKEFFEMNIKDIYEAVGKTKRMPKYVSALSFVMTTERDLEELKNFTTMNEMYLLDAKQAVDQAIETVKLNVQWFRMHQKYVDELLNKY